MNRFQTILLSLAAVAVALNFAGVDHPAVCITIVACIFFGALSD